MINERGKNSGNIFFPESEWNLESKSLSSNTELHNFYFVFFVFFFNFSVKLTLHISFLDKYLK